MKIILTHEVDRLGSAGDVVEVKDGYGRNYLIPRGYAVRWTRGAQKQIDQIAAARARRHSADLETAQETETALKGQVLTIAKTAGSNGRLFGAVTTADVAAAASELTGKQIDRQSVALKGHIKSVGEYEATIKLHEEVTAVVTVSVVAE